MTTAGGAVVVTVVPAVIGGLAPTIAASAHAALALGLADGAPGELEEHVVEAGPAAR